MLRQEVSIALKTNEWNPLKVQFRELVRDESLRGELEKFFGLFIDSSLLLISS